MQLRETEADIGSGLFVARVKELRTKRAPKLQEICEGLSKVLSKELEISTYRLLVPKAQ